MELPQIYINGLPILTQEVHLDSLRHSVEYLSATTTRRALDGTLWIQQVTGWVKRRVTISGQGLPTTGFGQYLYSPAVYTSGDLSVGGIIVEVSGANRDIWTAQDDWSVVIEET